MSENQEAIAIQWEGDDSAPYVVAVGQGINAVEIVQAAIKAKVPMLNNPMLMEELMQLQKTEAIPSHLYIAVAQILAFVRFMEGKVGPQRPKHFD